MKHRLVTLAIGLVLALGIFLALLGDASSLLLDVIPSLLTSAAVTVDSGELDLELAPNGSDGWQAVLTNRGTRPIILVAPGDGSSGGLRTPSLEWTVEELNGLEAEQPMMLLCGTINPLRPSEILLVRPGASTAFDLGRTTPLSWTGLEQYHVTLRYTNDPAIEWSGGLPMLDLGHWVAWFALRRSTVCTVVSNRVLVDRR